MNSQIKVYSYNKCATCRKALKWLDDRKISYELIDIIRNPPSKEQIKKAIDQYGTTKILFNTSGKSYRELGSETVKAMNEKEAILALISDGKLIKRPFLIASNKCTLIGFKENLWQEKLL
tara:strand:- start:170 stop:529 length:360 start_codon:yes stop_codon:yes gene_type:complete